MTNAPRAKKKLRRRNQESNEPAGPKIFRIRSTYDERKNYEDPDNYSDSGVGVAVDGVRPDDGGATTDARADERNADYCAGKGQEDAPRTGAEQTGGETGNGQKPTRTDERSGPHSGRKPD